jgi:hypothetical protein
MRMIVINYKGGARDAITHGSIETIDGDGWQRLQ